MLTKEAYNLISHSISTNREGNTILVCDLVDSLVFLLKGNNPKFNEAKFREACREIEE